LGTDKLLARAMLALQPALAQQPVVADAMEALRRTWEQEAPDKLVGGERHCAYRACPLRR